MKKIVSFLAALMLLIACQANAQWVPLSVSAADDTLTDAQTGYLYTKLPQNGNVGYYTAQLDLTRVSGTLAGIAYLEGSIDTTLTEANRKYTRVGGGNDSLLIVNGATFTGRVYIKDKKDLCYRWRIAQTGTVKCIPSGKILFYNPNK